MPVTAKLSKAFYDRFGDEIVTELVELLNQVNDANRADLTHVIEANNRRIDGKFAQLRAEVRADLTEGISTVRRELVDGNAALRVQIAGVRADLMKWSFAFWVGAVLAIAALAGVLRWTS